MFILAGATVLTYLAAHLVYKAARLTYNAGYFVVRSLLDYANPGLLDPATRTGPSATLANVLSLSVSVTHSVGRYTTSRRVTTLVRFHHEANQNTEAGGRNLQVDA